MPSRAERERAARVERVMQTFVTTLTEGGNGVEEILAAVQGEERTSQGFDTGWEQTDREVHTERAWHEFCRQHGIDGERFREVMDPVLDMWTGVVEENQRGRVRRVTFRDVAESSGYINLIDMIGTETDDEPRQYILLQMWLRVAHYLALHPSVPTPEWMRA